MAGGKTNPRVEAFMHRAAAWREAFERLRAILADSPLTEDFKWGKPCYTFEGGNVVLMHGFKDYCALLFIKGALLRDERSILVRQTKNVQAARQIRFTGAQEIAEMEPILRQYVREAIEVERAGLSVDFERGAGAALPEEFQARLDQSPALKTAFEALTPGRQRGYNLYFSAPKKAETRASRVEKCVPRILSGKGLDD